MNGVMKRKHVALVIFLCLTVVFQMLGVPAPLLDAGNTFEIDESSIQEGWSIHSSLPDVIPASGYTRFAEPQRSVRVPLLSGALFRPPLA